MLTCQVDDKPQSSSRRTQSEDDSGLTRGVSQRLTWLPNEHGKKRKPDGLTVAGREKPGWAMASLSIRLWLRGWLGRAAAETVLGAQRCSHHDDSGV